ncbi:hypothetical protein ACWCV9_01645 [Streptomyces sp. NPDC001606]
MAGSEHAARIGPRRAYPAGVSQGRGRLRGAAVRPGPVLGRDETVTLTRAGAVPTAFRAATYGHAADTTPAVVRAPASVRSAGRRLSHVVPEDGS